MQFPGRVYQITCRGNERKTIFRDDQDQNTFLKTLKDIQEIYRGTSLGPTLDLEVRAGLEPGEGVKTGGEAGEKPIKLYNEPFCPKK